PRQVHGAPRRERRAARRREGARRALLRGKGFAMSAEPSSSRAGPPSRSEAARVVLRVLSRYHDLLESGALEDLSQAIAALYEPRWERAPVERLEEVVDMIAAHLERARAAEQETAAVRTRMMQSDRLATLCMLAAGVAHEINNPAAFILLGIDLLDRLLH